MTRTRISRRQLKEAQKYHADKRTALIRSINTKEEFQQALMPVFEEQNNSPRLNVHAYKTMRTILMRAHQMLEQDDFWSVIDKVIISNPDRTFDISPQDIAEMVNDEIKDATASAVNAPFQDYFEELMKRAAKLSRDMKAGKYNQEIFKLKYGALYAEYRIMADAWDKQQIDRPEDAPPTYKMFSWVFDKLATWLE